jgi:hypothetical protein
MSRNPHSEFLKYHGFVPEDSGDIPRTELEIKLTMQQVLQELRKLNT